MGIVNNPVNMQRTSIEAYNIVISQRKNTATRLDGIQDSLTIHPILAHEMYSDSILQTVQMVDTVLFAVNINEHGGFYLVPGDLRLPEIIAYSDSGEFGLEPDTTTDTVPSSILKGMLSNYCLTITEDTPIHELDPWEPPIRPEYPPFPDSVAIWRVYETLSPWETTDSVPIMLPVEWHQGYPYNNRLGNGQYYTGCVPIAVAQLLAYHRYPQGIPTFPFDWNLMTASDDVIQSNWIAYMGEVGELLRWICEGLNVQFGPDVTSAYMDDVSQFLSQAGFSHPSSLKNYDKDMVVQSLKSARPVLMRGNDGLHASGHAWVIDGYKEQQRIKTTIDTYWMTTTEEIQHQELLHCNWGGSNNGYYVEGIFDRYHLHNGNSGANQSDYYQYGLKMIDNIYP